MLSAGECRVKTPVYQNAAGLKTFRWHRPPPNTDLASSFNSRTS